MIAQLTLWCLGSKATPAGAPDARLVEFFAEPTGRLATISAARLGDRIETTATDLVGFVDAAAGFPADAFDRAAERLIEDAAVQGVIMSSRAPMAGFNRWERLPLRVASLMEPLGAGTAAEPRPKLVKLENRRWLSRAEAGSRARTGPGPTSWRPLVDDPGDVANGPPGRRIAPILYYTA